VSAPLLELEGVSCGYGQLTVVHDVSATVAEGEIVAFLGSNGAGKSTLLKTVVGLVRARAGRISTPDRELTQLSTEAIARAGVILVPEGRQLFGSMTVMENLLLGGHAHRGAGAAQRRLLDEVFALFPVLAQRRRQVAGSMSGGEQQMVAIARALMARPRLLLLDEPSLGLAPIVLAAVFDVLRRLRESGLTILVVEQNAMLTLELADRAYVLERGRVAVAGAASQLATDPRIQRAYLGLVEQTV
jgi:branched-chain amino acid transport system ATP-binding protein